MSPKNLKLLNEFVNDHSLCKGGGITCTITEHGCEMTHSWDDGSFKCEDSNMLHDIIRGAEQLIWYLERNGYEIRKARK
jgi:hypothetical protein